MAKTITFFNNGFGMIEIVTSTGKETKLDIDPREELRKAYEDGFEVYHREFYSNGDVAVYLH